MKQPKVTKREEVVDLSKQLLEKYVAMADLLTAKNKREVMVVELQYKGEPLYALQYALNLDNKLAMQSAMHNKKVSAFLDKLVDTLYLPESDPRIFTNDGIRSGVVLQLMQQFKYAKAASLTTEQLAELKDVAKTLGQESGAELTPIAYDHNGHIAIGYVKKPLRFLQLEIMDAEMFGKDINELINLNLQFLLHEQSDPLIMSVDELRVAAIGAVAQVVLLTIPNLKKN
jgi:hypothetical protein